MKRPRTAVSDHAIVRYLERVQGFDIERLRCEIGRRVEAAAETGAAGVVIDGFVYKLQDSATGPVVVTVMRRGLFTAEPKGRAGFRPRERKP